jgi:hypothetical protein
MLVALSAAHEQRMPRQGQCAKVRHVLILF